MRPSPASSRSAAAIASRTAGMLGDRLVGDAHVEQHLRIDGQPGGELVQRAARARGDREQRDRRHRPVAGRAALRGRSRGPTARRRTGSRRRASLRARSGRRPPRARARCPSRSSAFSKPMFAITVPTTVSPGSSPRRARSRADDQHHVIAASARRRFRRRTARGRRRRRTRRRRRARSSARSPRARARAASPGSSRRSRR